MTTGELRYGAEVAAALRDGAPMVALESTIIAHGLPRPDNLRVARQIEQVVREHGAVPATIGVIGGEVVVGLDDPELTTLAGTDGVTTVKSASTASVATEKSASTASVATEKSASLASVATEKSASLASVAKLSARDLALAAATGIDGATTVAGTVAVAAAAGIRVFATGGLGGVHREATTTFDESADLTTLARTPMVVVCAGVKSILDVGATLERLETLGVSVVGYRSTRFPGFFVTDSGHELDWSMDSPEQVAAAAHAQRAQQAHRGALVVANPLPTDEQLDPARHDRVLADGLSMMEREGITGKQVTPFLLAHFHSATGGESLAVNIRIILRNAALAAQIAVALAVPR